MSNLSGSKPGGKKRFMSVIALTSQDLGLKKATGVGGRRGAKTEVRILRGGVRKACLERSKTQRS